MRTAAKWLGAVALAPVLGLPAHAATVTGTVRGPDGTPFRGAFVQAQHAGTKITTSVLSDRQGRYRIEDLPAGTYQVRVRAVGYDGTSRDGMSFSARNRPSPMNSRSRVAR